MANKTKRTGRKRNAPQPLSNAQLISAMSKLKINATPKSNGVKRRIRRRPQKGLNPTNTINRIENNLSRPSGVNMFSMNPYVRCRLNPFAASGGDGIPDGGNSNYIVIDSTVINTIVDSASSGFTIQTLSLNPITACLASDGGPPLALSTIKVDGVPICNGTTGNFPADLYPLGIAPAFKRNGSAPGNILDDPYQSTGCRIVAVQHKLTYTGPPLSASGTYVVTPNTITFRPGVTVGDGASPSVPKGIWHNSDATSTFTTQVNTPCWNADGRLFPNTYIKDSKLSRIDRALVVTPRHKTSDFKIMTTDPVLPFITTDNTSSAVACTNLVTGTSPTNDQIGVYSFDNDWQHFQITVSGYAPGSSFTLETALCIEYSLTSNSAFAPLTKKTSPHNPAAIETAQKLVNDLPTGGYM